MDLIKILNIKSSKLNSKTIYMNKYYFFEYSFGDYNRIFIFKKIKLSFKTICKFI